jgi:IS605 OrfB family transposase
MSEHTSTYQARIAATEDVESVLDAYAVHYGHVERCLYADMRKSGKKAVALKNDYLVRFKITARQFNAIARNLAGKIDSVKELLPLRIQETELAIARAKKVLGRLKNKNKIHQKKRRLANLESRLAAVISQKESENPRICFGSRDLFRKQFNLEENGYSFHKDWLADWQAKRSSQFYVLGSKDETAGCQGCVATENPDGTFNLRLRLPGFLVEEEKYVHLRDIRFSYGGEVIRQALRCGQAISYRFIRDDKGWRVMVSTDFPKIKTISFRQAGAIGVDINEDCLAVSEIDRYGNLAGTCVISLVTYGKSTNQAKAIIGDVVKEIVAQAIEARKPIVIEKLDFKKKRAELEAEHPGQARMLSSLLYNKIIQQIHSAAYRAGIEVIEVNPAFTSTIGAVNYAKSCGISIHQGAAIAIARRGTGFRERPIKAVEATIPTAKGDHVTFPLPARNRGKHVWSFWSDVRKIQKAVLAAHLRPPKGEPGKRNPSQGKVPRFTVRPRDANHRQHCSVGVMDDIPW